MRVTVPVPLLVREMMDVLGEVPLGMTPLKAMLPEPPNVSVFVPFPEMRRFCEMVSVWLAVLALIVAPPVVPPIVKILSVVSFDPVQFSWPELLVAPRVIELFVPSELFAPVFPIVAAVSEPLALIKTAPEKLLFVPVILTPPVPEVLFNPPLPLINPERVA